MSAKPSLFKTYYKLSKPGIVYGNAITAIAGFFLAAQGNPPWLALLGLVIGICFVMGSACVFNNYIDRDIDALMKRTKVRSLVTGEVPKASALTYATILGLLGFLVLILLTNWLTVLVGVIGFFVYVGPYTLLKRRTVHGTLIGSISGAVPPLAGYIAVTNSIDSAALLLFLILALWQMPHFYAIAMFRSDDYAAASIPVLPLKRGMDTAKTHILLYTAAYLVAITLLTVLGYTGYTYLIINLGLGLYWLWMGLRSLKTDSKLWARKMFRFSLIVLTVFSVTLCLEFFLP